MKKLKIGSGTSHLNFKYDVTTIFDILIANTAFRMLKRLFKRKGFSKVIKVAVFE
jgi:hypothetical protein